MISEIEKIAGLMLDQVEQLLTQIHRQPVRLKIVRLSNKVNIGTIRGLICYYFQKDWEEILQPTRKEDVVLPRMCFNYLCKEFTAITDDELGAIFNKNRTSIIQNYNSVEGMLHVKDPCIYSKMKPIIDQLNELQNDTASNKITTASAGTGNITGA